MKSTNSYEEIEKILNSISELLKVDMLMVDVDCRKVAGVGTYEHVSGNENYNDSFFGRALSRKSTLLVYDNHIVDKVDIDYYFKDMTGIVCLYHPLIINDELIGVLKLETNDSYAKKKIIDET